MQCSIEEAISRIYNIDFFKPLTANQGLDILPAIKEIIDDNRELLYSLHEKFPISKLKRELHQRNLYGIAMRQSTKCLDNVKQKIDSRIDEIVKDRRKYGWYVWSTPTDTRDPELRSPPYLIKNNITKNVSAYLWNEILKSESEENLYKKLIEIYELGALPLGPQYIQFIDTEGNQHFEKSKFVVEIPLDTNQVMSNIARGTFVLQDPHYLSYDKLKPRNRRLLDIIKERKDELNCVVLSEPEIIDSYSLATFVDGDEYIKHVHYWSEKYDQLRPLIVA